MSTEKHSMNTWNVVRLPMFANTNTTIILSGILKKFMVVARQSSGTYLDRRKPNEGQNKPTHTSNTKKLAKQRE